METQNKYKRREIKTTQKTQITEVQKSQTTTKLKSILIISLAIVCLLGLFLFEIPENESKRLKIATAEYKSAIDSSKYHKNKLVEGSTDTLLLKNYVEAFSFYKKKKSIWKSVKEEEKFNQFDSFQLFAGEFGKWLAVLIYAIANLVFFFWIDKLNKAWFYFHLSFIFSGIFFLNWTLQNFKEYSKIEYYSVTVLITILFIVGVYYATKTFKIKDNVKRAKELSQKEKLRTVTKFAIENLPKDKREEFVTILKNYTKIEQK